MENFVLSRNAYLIFWMIFSVLLACLQFGFSFWVILLSLSVGHSLGCFNFWFQNFVEKIMEEIKNTY